MNKEEECESYCFIDWISEVEIQNPSPKYVPTDLKDSAERIFLILVAKLAGLNKKKGCAKTQ